MTFFSSINMKNKKFEAIHTLKKKILNLFYRMRIKREMMGRMWTTT